MSWRVTPDPRQFTEAVEWFRRRVPVTEAEFERLSMRARSRAFNVFEIMQLDLTLEVWEALDHAIAHGTGYREFATAVSERLQTAWGRQDSGRIEVIFRTNVQSAYAAGRLKQMSDPAVLAARPYWLYDAVLDDRTTDMCREYNGTVLLADDPWWHSRYPPNHWKCRSGVRTVTRAAAERRGVTAVAPATEPDADFRTRPSLEDWQPDLRKYPPELRDLARARIRR